MIKKSDIWVRIAQLFVVFTSFIVYSSVFFPLLSSDDAVPILMLFDFNLPQDLFFWGQDRVGSLIPLLGQIPFKLLGINLLWSESITHYIILILGFLAFSSFFDSPFSKIAFSLVWFLPIDPFLGLVRFSFGLQYSFIAFGLYCLKYFNEKTTKSEASKYIYWILAFLSFLTAVWITETAVVTITIILFVSFIWQLKTAHKIPLDSIVFSVIATILGLLIIFMLKKTVEISSYYEYYQQLLNTPSEIIKSISILFHKLLESFTLKNRNPFLIAYCYLCVVLLLTIPITTIFGKISKIEKWRWITIFILDGFAFLAINILSHWSLLNGVARRYFIGVYIVFWIAFLIFTEHISGTTTKKIVKSLTLITLLVGGISIPYGYKYIYPKRLTPKAKIVSEFKQLGSIGIISEYWNSYGTSFVDPENIKATPHDKCEVRNINLVDSVFAQPRIFLIKDMWLDTFPDNISQFGRLLERKGEEFRIGDCNVCEYQLHLLDTTLRLNDLKYSHECIISDNNTKLSAQFNNSDIIYKHIVSGPYLTLLPGKYVVDFYLSTSKGDENKSVGVIDVVTEFGKTTLCSKKIKPNINNISEAGEETQLFFSIKSITKNMEFRIYYYGEADLTFSHITIEQIK